MQSKREIIENKIASLEKEGRWDVDINDDPATTPLKKGQVDYSYSKASTRIQTKIANFFARRFFNGLIRKKQLIIRSVDGLENFRSVKGAAIITSNHFHPFEQYALYKVIEKDLGKRDLYKVIREGNYTSFKGLFGYFFRHCNTLPIPSDIHVMKEFLNGLATLFSRGEKVLVYPEQAMWYNYRKPRPLKSGAFNFAVKYKVPVIPFFISMEDTDSMDENGYPIQAYSIHIGKPIYTLEGASPKEDIERMQNEDYAFMKAEYEKNYGIPLAYSYEEKTK